MIDRGFWRGRRVLLTGHSGIKGGWLSLWLQRLGAEITGYSLPAPTEPSLFDAGRVAEGMTSISGDVRDGAALARAMHQARPEIVIHMAAQSLVRYSYDHPVETFATNVMGLINLFEAARTTSSVAAIVNVTSDKCYENREWLWGYRETEAMGGHDPYSSSKGCAELITAAWRRSYFGLAGVALASARAGNVIGGGDWAADRLVPDIMRALLSNRPVQIRNPQSIRPWQHVLEPLSGYLLLAEKLAKGGVGYADGWNFGPADGGSRPVHWMVDRLIMGWGGGASWEQDSQTAPREANILKLDCSKAHAILGWTPLWEIDTAIDRILDWHKRYEAGEDMRRVTLDQIEDYERALLDRAAARSAAIDVAGFRGSLGTEVESKRGVGQ